MRRGDIFGDSAVTGQTSQATYLSAGSTLLICIPPKIFNAILHSSASASDLNVSNDGVVQEDSILSNHVEKFLDVLYLYDDGGGGREEDDQERGGKEGSTRMSATAVSRASAFNLSQQSLELQQSSQVRSSESEQSDQPSVQAKQASLRNAPRVSQVFANSDSTEQQPPEKGQRGCVDDHTQDSDSNSGSSSSNSGSSSSSNSGSNNDREQQQGQGDNSSEPDSEPDSESEAEVEEVVPEPVQSRSTKLAKPMVEPISVSGYT